MFFFQVNLYDPQLMSDVLMDNKRVVGDVSFTLFFAHM